MILPSLERLLAQAGLSGVPEQRLQHAGFSGASLTRLVREDGAAFVLKRLSLERDWIMRATDDEACREANIAAMSRVTSSRVMNPAVGAARDGSGYAVLMQDISSRLLPEGPISRAQLDSILEGVAELHRCSWPDAVPWCAVDKRLTLLTPQGAAVARAGGAPVADDIERGWRLFERHATDDARETMYRLFADPTPLVAALETLPFAFLHGDLKFDNVGLDEDGRLWLIDWAMTLVAPPAVEMGWFLAVNSRRLPASLDDVMGLYAEAAGVPPALRAKHDALLVLCGLLLRGWRKALDAEEGDPVELAWWCERAARATAYL